MKQTITYKENPKFSKPKGGRGRKPCRFVIVMRTKHRDNSIVKRPIAYAKTVQELKTKLRAFIREDRATLDNAAQTVLSAKAST